MLPNLDLTSSQVPTGEDSEATGFRTYKEGILGGQRVSRENELLQNLERIWVYGHLMNNFPNSCFVGFDPFRLGGLFTAAEF